MQYQNLVNAAVNIRRATPKDSQQILSICKNSFPLSFRWQVISGLSLQWWKQILTGEASETWTIEYNESVVAFCVLVTDERGWAEENIFQKRPRMIHLISAIRHPIMAARTASKRMISFVKKSRPNTVSKELPDWWEPSQRIWLELIAVDIEKRGLGFAERLLAHCDMIAKGLHRRGIALRVETENLPAKSCYEKNGFRLYSSDANGCLYIKFIEG